MTKREKFEVIANLADVKANAELSEFIANEIALLDKKSAYKSSKPTKRQTENEVIKQCIKEVLTDEGQTVTEILAQLNTLEQFGVAGLTNQRVSALLRQMDVHKEIVKGKSLFSLS